MVIYPLGTGVAHSKSTPPDLCPPTLRDAGSVRLQLKRGIKIVNPRPMGFNEHIVEYNGNMGIIRKMK